MSPSRFRAALVCAGMIGVAVSAAGLERAGGNWPQWRGPDGDSTSDQTGLPVTWSEQTGVVWKARLPGWSDSTPAIWGDAVFVTTQEDDALLLLKIHKNTGVTEWTRRVGSGSVDRMSLAVKPGVGRRQRFHRLQNLASPSPVTDGELVFVHFGTGELAAYDFEGQRHWHRNLQADYGPYTIWWGHANSPVLFEDLLISVCMEDSLAGRATPPVPSYVVAHDKHTGTERWKTLRMTGANAEACDAYTTPIIDRTRTDRPELIVMGANQLDAYDPATGKRLWYLPGLKGGRTITGPTAGLGMVFATQGMRGSLLAIKAEGAGERSQREIVWKYDQGTPDTCCPVLWGGRLFMIADNGIATCLDARTGRLRWRHRLNGAYKASPLAAEGRIYFLNTTGLCTVVAASSRFTELAKNQLDDEMIASPAVSAGRLYLRGHQSLYCLGKAPHQESAARFKKGGNDDDEVGHRVLGRQWSGMLPGHPGDELGSGPGGH